MKILDDLVSFAENGGILKKIGIVVCNPCFHSVLLYRLSSFLYKIHLSIFAKIIWYINRIVFNVDIDYRSNLAGGLHIVHGLGIVIGRNVETKGSVKIYQGVTIGGSGKIRVIDEKTINQPIIEEDVVLYTNSIVVGPVIVGRGNHINAAQVVSSDLPRRY